MSTYREIAYMCLDEIKNISDDSDVVLEHIIFLMSKYRGYILNANYRNLKKTISESNYQTICVELEKQISRQKLCDEDNILISKEQVPNTMSIGYKNIYPMSGFSKGRFNWVNSTRFKYVGNNKYIKNEIYVTIGPDNKLYIKSDSNSFTFMDKVKFTAIFEDPEKASLLECNDAGNCVNNCDILDKRFPLEDAFIPTLIQVVVQELVGAAWRPKDDDNNAKDDLSDFSTVLSKYTNNAFKRTVNPKYNNTDE